MLSDDICSNCENKLSGCRREVEWYNSTPICRSFVERQAHISESDFDKMQKDSADMRAELAALKEKYRWRDADKEPAPKQADDRTRFVLVHERQYDTMTTAQYFYEEKSWYDFGGESVDVDYWRPLEFPEAKA